MIEKPNYNQNITFDHRRKQTQQRICCVHVQLNFNVNSLKSAYIKHHSTETTHLSVDDHIVKAVSHQQVTCLTRLALSAAFDTIDHYIPLKRLSSWFHISFNALSLSLSLSLSLFSFS